MTADDLDAMWERLAEAVTAAGPARENLLLAKLALLLGREVGDLARVEALIALAIKDLP